MLDILNGIVLTSATTSNSVASAIQGTDLSGILNEIISLLPVVLPVVVGFIGVRKGISFLIGSLRRA